MEWRKWAKAVAKWAGGNFAYNWLTTGGGLVATGKVVGAVLAGIVLAVWGALSDIPAPYLALLGLGGFAAVVWATNGVLAARERRNAKRIERTRRSGSERREWRSRSWGRGPGRSRTEWKDGGATAAESHTADALISAPEALIVSVERPEWTRVQHTVLVLKVKVTVTNQTDQQERLGGLIFRAPEGVGVVEDADLVREIEAIRASAYPMPGIVGPHDSVSGWYVYTFRAQPMGGTPAYEIGVEDELKNIYWVHVPEGPAKGWDVNA